MNTPVLLSGLALLGAAVSGLAAVAVALRSRSAIRAVWSSLESLRRSAAAADRQHLLELQSAHGQIAALRAGLSEPLRFTSQHGEDIFLVEHFRFAREGVFVEIGGYDGIRFSNSHALEQLGWRGVLVEAHPRLAEACRRNRPLAAVEASAIGGPGATGHATFNMVEGDGADALSFIEGDEQHRARCAREGRGLKTVQVPLISIQELITRHRLTRIDLLSIDIEGGEEQALLGLDFSRFAPRVIIAEANDDSKATGLKALLHAKGYHVVRQLGVNLVFALGQPGDAVA